MKLISFVPPDLPPQYASHGFPDSHSRAGVLLGNDVVVDLATAAPLVLEEASGTQWDMVSLLHGRQEVVNLETAAEIVAAVIDLAGEGLEESGFAEAGDDSSLAGNGSQDSGMAGNLLLGGVTMLLPLSQVRLLAPLPRPASLRFVAAFAGEPQPVLHFGNHGAIYGPDQPIPMPHAGSGTLGYRAGVACVVGMPGHDLTPDEAPDYIAGYTLLVDWLDDDPTTRYPLHYFATSLGPWLVTPDELDIYTDDEGGLALDMRARINRVDRWRSNTLSADYTFATLLSYASRDVLLYPGDVLGAVSSYSSNPLPLERGDSLELEVTALGTLRTSIE